MQRPVALAGGAAILILLGVAVYGFWPRLSPAPAASIGGPFALIDEDSRAFSDRDLRGKPTAVFFGFTYCPEICPTTLASLTRWMKALGPDADRLNVVFVTVDPARDTPAALKAFLSPFDPRIRGLTGSDQPSSRPPRPTMSATARFRWEAVATPWTTPRPSI